MRFIRPALLAVLALLVGPTVAAQTTQYTAPGGAAGGAQTREEIEAAMEEARWRLGPIRLAPWLALRGLTYEDDVFVEADDEGGGEDGGGGEGEAVSDVHGSVGAGLTAYLPTGKDVFWVVQALPEYLFWVDLDERNRLIGRYGAGVYADLNRLRLALDAQQREEQQTVTSESAQQVVGESTVLHAVAELELTGAVSVVVDATQQELAYELADGTTVGNGFDFSALDRRERVLAGELRYRPNEKIELAFGAETTDVEFDGGGRDLSSTGTSPYLHVVLAGNRFELDARVVRRELEPEPGSALLPVEVTQGSGRLGFEISHRLTFGLYGSRSTAYALAGDYTQFETERLGAEVGIPIGRRLRLRLFGETGSDDYEALPGVVPRRDDVTAWGAAADFEIGDWLTYRAGVHQVDYDSNLDPFDRDYLRIQSSLILSTGDWVWR